MQLAKRTDEIDDEVFEEQNRMREDEEYQQDLQRRDEDQ